MGYLEKLIKNNYPLSNISSAKFGGYTMTRVGRKYWFTKKRRKSYFEFDKDNYQAVNFCSVEIRDYDNKLCFSGYGTGVFDNHTPCSITGNEKNDIVRAMSEVTGLPCTSWSTVTRSEAFKILLDE